MASFNLFLPLLLVSHVILFMPSDSFACVLHCESEINLLLYLHQIVSGPGRNQITTFSSTEAEGFGTTAINDWLVLNAPQPDNATIVARAKGMHFQADVAGPGWFSYFAMVFQDGRFSGSAFQVFGISTPTEGQLSIIGGTGEFAMARGVIKYKALSNPPPNQSIKELNIHAFYVPPPASSAGAAIQ